MNAARTPRSDDPDGSASALGDDLGWALGTVLRAYRNAVGEVMADLPGGARGYQILTMAGCGLAGTQLALAGHLGVDRTVMTYLLDDMERAGLIERRCVPGDRRAKQIAPTPCGRAKAAELRQRLRCAEERVLHSLEPADRQRFRQLLRQVAIGVDGPRPQQPGCEP